jgi:dolichyl-phosphate beta-glucosyltransferase
MKEPLVSVIIPAYNEEERLEPSLGVIADYFAARPYAVEMLVVDDGSTDRTCEIVNTFAEKSPMTVRLEKNPRNMGKGAAVKRGMLAGEGKYLLFTDADLSTPIESVEGFLPLLESGAKVVVGTRKHPDAKIKRSQPWLRRNLGKGFVVLANIMLGTRLTDFTCGFKSFSNEAAKEIFTRSRIIGWAFDAEILYLAHRLGYQIFEIPVTWAHSSGSRVRLRKDVLGSFKGLLEIRRNSRRGLYNLPRKGEAF